MKNLSPKSISQLNSNRKNENHSHCATCGSTDFISGVGRKSKEISLKCAHCKTFIGYIPIGQLSKAHKRKKLTRSIEIIEQQGFQGDAALSILSEIGGEN